MSALFISRAVNCVWLCHVTLLLWICVCTCKLVHVQTYVLCAGISVSAIQCHILGYTPFHTVSEISVFALIVRPENTEGVNQCPVTKPTGQRGGLVLYTVSQSISFLGNAEHYTAAKQVSWQHFMPSKWFTVFFFGWAAHLWMWQCIITTAQLSLQICMNELSDERSSEVPEYHPAMFEPC